MFQKIGIAVQILVWHIAGYVLLVFLFFLAGNNEGVDDSLKKICQLVPGNSSSLRYYRTLIMYFNSW